jgi:hypothetical protein
LYRSARCGIFRGIQSDGKSERYPTPSDVLDDIGEKPAAAFTKAVMRAKVDLRDYRSAFGQWVADHSERGLANWINDRLWAHLAALADGIPGMEVYEKGPLREVVIGLNYRFRFKRHDVVGNVASYPTDAFLDFVCQPASQLPGMEETRLIAGYEWLKEQRDIGAAVITLRDGKENVIWLEQLRIIDDAEGAGKKAAPILMPEQPGPTSPTIDTKEVGSERGDQTGVE